MMDVEVQAWDEYLKEMRRDRELRERLMEQSRIELGQRRAEDADTKARIDRHRAEDEAQWERRFEVTEAEIGAIRRLADAIERLAQSHERD